MKIEYIIIRSESKRYFEDNVNEKLKEGWLFHGDTSIIVVRYNIWYHQAFCRNLK